MNKEKTNNSERESEKEKRILKTRKAILEASDKIMKENGLNVDQQMAMMVCVTVEKIKDLMKLSTFAVACKATGILLEELHQVSLDLRNDSIQV